MKLSNLQEVKMLAMNSFGKINRIYLHWSAGHYNQTFEDYHINITGDGNIHISTNDFSEYKPHTWRRNTGAIAVSLDCCYNAQANSGYNTNFGNEPPTPEQIESMAKVVAALCSSLNLSITKENVMTHAEIASLDNYGPGSGDSQTRWDLWYLRDFDGKMKSGGDIIRGKANWYKTV